MPVEREVCEGAAGGLAVLAALGDRGEGCAHARARDPRDVAGGVHGGVQTLTDEACETPWPQAQRRSGPRQHRHTGGRAGDSASH